MGDSVMELSTFSSRPNPAANLSTRTKSAFTRLFNKQNHMNPYALESVATKKKRVKAVNADDDDVNAEDNAESEGEGEGEDAMIKKPAAKTKKAAEKKPAAKKSASGKRPAKKSSR